MLYKGYEVQEKGNSVIVNGIRDFDLEQTFECGQCFRWKKQTDGTYIGVALGKVIRVWIDGTVLHIENTSIEDFEKLWFEYFDLGRDYSRIKELAARDEIMQKAVEFGAGIRILKQDFFETLISFIISANNQIPRIKKIVETLSQAYGNELIFENTRYYTFPSPERLGTSCLDDISICRGGFRCKYILGASRIFFEAGADQKELAGLSADKAREKLCSFPGIGPKVADCTLLFSGTRQDVFPTDVWVKRVMEELYFKRTTSMKEILAMARSYFGPLCGFAQQYLFYYARQNKIGVK